MHPAEGWAGVIASAAQGHIDQLHRFFYSGLLGFYSRRGYVQDAPDLAMNAVLATARSIGRGEIKDPNRLPGYVRTVAMRCLAATIEGTVKARTRECEMTPQIADRGQTPEEMVIEKQQATIMNKVLGAIPGQEREVLTRFYLHGQTKEQICEQMQLTDDQFRNIKSRAKLRVTSMVQSVLSRNSGAERCQSKRAA
jgi:RNA polymerase sigma-70 factor (ECF subfamily)